MTHQQAPNDLMAATVVPHLVGSGSHQISYLHADSTSLAIHMVIPTRAVGDVLFNGNPSILTADCFRPVPQKPEFSWCNKNVSSYVPWDSVMTVTCSVDKFLLAVIETDSLRGTAYTYLTDYAPAIFIRFEMDTAYCEYDSIAFTYNAHQVDSLTLHCPDGRILTLPPFIIPHADSTDEGAYILEGFNSEHNLVYTDSIYIHVHSRPTFEYNDTILENQLPWTYRDRTFLSESDTVFVNASTGLCDSLVHYRLFVYRNVTDTLFFFLCPDAVPFAVNDTFSISSDTVITYLGAHGEDSVVVYRVILLHDSDTAFTDSILESQLPWFFFDTLFSDTISNYPFHLVNEAGCDSVIHYSLFIFWDGDHCDTTLTFPTLVTPNGDGINDRFVIGGLIENNCFRYNELLIYDRTGRLVYHARNIAYDADWWDPAAHRVPDATYFYVFKAHGVKIHTLRQGVIEVLR